MRGAGGRRAPGGAANLTDGTRRRATCPPVPAAANALDAAERGKREWEIAVDCLPQLVCLLDADARVLRANRTIERWSLGRVDDVAGRSIHELLHGGCADPGCLLSGYAQGAAEGLLHGQGSDCRIDDARLRRPLEFSVRPADGGGAAPRVRGVLVVTDVSASLQMEMALRNSQSELRLLSAQLLAAQEVERKRIAAELHDSVGASLSAILLGLQWAGGPAGAAELPALVERVREAIAEVRRIAMGLRPASLDDLGLIATLSWYFRELAAVHPQLRLAKRVEVGEGEIPRALKTTIFRIMQEAVTNAVRHAGSERIEVGLRRSGDELELVVEDHGRGFVLPQVESGGLGLTTMRERTALSGGAFSLLSRPGAGTRVRAVWTLSRQTDAAPSSGAGAI